MKLLANEKALLEQDTAFQQERFQNLDVKRIVSPLKEINSIIGRI